MKEKRKYFYVVVYALCILYITILSRTPALVRTSRPIPFWSFLDWLKGNWVRGGSIILNVVLFIPLGYLLARVKKSKWIPIITCLLLTITIELIQYYTYRGYFDIDDIIVNFLGGALGILCYKRFDSKFDSKLKGWPVSTIMLLAGIVGCLIISGNTEIYETQFAFRIESVVLEDNRFSLSGECYIYNREGLDYQIHLKDDTRNYPMETTVEGKHFIAKADVPEKEYEVDVVFNGYQPISTGTYIVGDKVEYVANALEPEVRSTDLDSIVQNGVLKVYNEDYDAFVYEFDNHLYWLIGTDFDASIIYHLYTTEPENLPEERKQYGFDNRGFRIDSEKELTETMNCGKYRVFSDIIPTEYYVTAIAVGMNKGPDILWREYFRPVR